MARAKRLQSSFSAIIATAVITLSLTPAVHAETKFQELGSGLGDYRTSVDINNQNQVLVQAITNDSSEFCNFCYITQYFITNGSTTKEIPIPNQSANKYATALNNNESFSGVTFYDSGNWLYSYISKGFIWSNGQFHEYSAPEGYTSSTIRDINDTNVGVGVVSGQASVVYGTAAVFSNGETQLLPHLSGKKVSSADAINESGVIAGSSMAEDGRMHLVIWENGIIKDLGVNGTGIFVKDMNNSGKIIGTIYNRYINSTSPRDIRVEHNVFMWENDSSTYLQAPEGSNSLDAFKVNNKGTVLGDFNGSDGIPRDITWDSSGAFTVIEYPIGEEYMVHARAVNDNGIIAGQYMNSVSNALDPSTTAKAFVFGDLSPPKPTTKNDCMKNGWKTYDFKNQGQCVSSLVKN